MAKWAKRLVGVGVLAGVGYALWRVLDERVREQDLTWTPQPFPLPPMPELPDPGAGTVVAPASAAADAPAWVDPVDGTCPVAHPVKAKLGSGIFHVPGGQMYDRTTPDRCYRDAAAAEADGLRASKR